MTVARATASLYRPKRGQRDQCHPMRGAGVRDDRTCSDAQRSVRDADGHIPVLAEQARTREVDRLDTVTHVRHRGVGPDWDAPRDRLGHAVREQPGQVFSERFGDLRRPPRSPQEAQHQLVAIRQRHVRDVTCPVPYHRCCELRDLEDVADLSATSADGGMPLVSATPLVDPFWIPMAWRDRRCVAQLLHRGGSSPDDRRTRLDQLRPPFPACFSGADGRTRTGDPFIMSVRRPGEAGAVAGMDRHATCSRGSCGEPARDAASAAQSGVPPVPSGEMSPPTPHRALGTPEREYRDSAQSARPHHTRRASPSLDG